jgi:hypothetical protein
LKNIQILWCLFKYIYLPLKIYSYILHTLKYLPNTLQYLHYIPLVYFTIPLIYSNMLSYTLKLYWNLFNQHFFVLPTLFLSFHYIIFSLLLFCLATTTTIMVPHILPKCCCTCYDMFTGIQKWSIFHEFHKSYWLVKYLDPKLISWDIINTCRTYIRWSQKPLTT